MRNFNTIINQIINKVPENKKSLLKQLNYNKNFEIGRPPEDILKWELTHETIINNIPKPTKNWELEIYSIFTTQSIKELKKLFRNETNNKRM